MKIEGQSPKHPNSPTDWDKKMLELGPSSLPEGKLQTEGPQHTQKGDVPVGSQI